MLPQPVFPEYVTLDLIDSNGTTIASYKLLDKLGNALLRNAQPMQPADSEIQTYQGDAKITIGEHEAEILLEGDLTTPPQDRIIMESNLYRNLMRTVKFGVAGYYQNIAIVRGISETQPIGPRAKHKYRATILYIPSEAFWYAASGSAGAANASQELYTVTAAGAAFTAGDLYKYIVWDTGESAQIVQVNSDTEVIVDRPRTVTSGSFTLYNTVIGVL